MGQGFFALPAYPSHIRERNLTKGLANTYLEQNTRYNVVDLADKLEELVIRQMLERKLALRDITWVRLAKDCMAVARNNLSTLQRRPDVLLDSFVACILSNLGLHLCEPDKHLLVRKAM